MTEFDLNWLCWSHTQDGLIQAEQIEVDQKFVNGFVW